MYMSKLGPPCVPNAQRLASSSFLGTSTHNAQQQEGYYADCAAGCATLLLFAAVYEEAVKGCELEDCEEKAVVQFFVQEALKNSTNSYLAFVSGSGGEGEGGTGEPVVFFSKEEFAVRVEMYTETLEQVAQANAQLKDYYVSGAAVDRPYRPCHSCHCCCLTAS